MHTIKLEFTLNFILAKNLILFKTYVKKLAKKIPFEFYLKKKDFDKIQNGMVLTEINGLKLVMIKPQKNEISSLTTPLI